MAHQDVENSPRTRSPGLTVVTLSPMDSTMPMNSWPYGSVRNMAFSGVCAAWWLETLKVRRAIMCPKDMVW